MSSWSRSTAAVRLRCGSVRGSCRSRQEDDGDGLQEALYASVAFDTPQVLRDLEYEFSLLLANGVTTIRNMIGDPKHLQWRESIQSGELLGPTIYTAGPIIDGDPPMWPGSVVVTTVEEARATVFKQKEAGYDFLKVYNGLSREAYDALIAAARTYRMPVVGHVPDEVGLLHALQSGLRSIEHLEGYDTALLREGAVKGHLFSWDRLDEKRFAEIARRTEHAGTWNCPTLVVFQKWIAPEEKDLLRQRLAQKGAKYVSPQTVRSWRLEETYLKDVSREWAQGIRVTDKVRKQIVKALHDAGARILLGTDYLNPFVIPGFSIHEELRNLVDAGLTPYEAIRAGTRDAAEFLGALDEFGTIEVGKRADLLLLDENPLLDVRNVERIAGVMVRGRWLPGNELRERLERIAKSFRENTDVQRDSTPSRRH